jgi:hypothetical protein
MLNYIIFDEEREFKIDDLQCLVIGRDKVESVVENSKYHVLIIQRVRSYLGADIYERVGVASLRPVHVGSEGSWVRIR